MSTPHQRQLIGYMRKLLALTDEAYYAMIWNTWNVESSKDLNYAQAESFLSQLKRLASSQGKYTPKARYKSQKWKYNNFADRSSKMATPAQLRLVESLWFQVSRQTTDEARSNALNTFIKRLTGKERLAFLTKQDVTKLVNAMNNMKENLSCKI